jgi:anti-anti-sigma factor
VDETLQVIILPNGAGRCTLLLRGALTAHTLHELQDAFTCVIADGYRYLRVDLEGVQEMQSCVFGIFMEAMVALENKGGCVSFTNPSRHAEKVFRLLGVEVG